MDGILKFNIIIYHIFIINFILSTMLITQVTFNINFNKKVKKARFMALKYYWPEKILANTFLSLLF